MKLDQLLEGRQIAFERMHHERACGASRLAETLHVPGKLVAKSVLLRTELGYVIAVLPADRQVDLEKARECLDEEWVELASEAEIRQLFPDCEVGAMPPFGSVYHLRTVIDESLTEDAEIIFEGHDHTEAIRMAFADYDRLERPLRGRFTTSMMACSTESPSPRL